MEDGCQFQGAVYQDSPQGSIRPHCLTGLTPDELEAEVSKRAYKVLRLLAKVMESGAMVLCLSSESSDLLKGPFSVTLIFSFLMSRLMVLDMRRNLWF